MDSGRGASSPSACMHACMHACMYIHHTHMQKDRPTDSQTARLSESQPVRNKPMYPQMHIHVHTL